MVLIYHFYSLKTKNSQCHYESHGILVLIALETNACLGPVRQACANAQTRMNLRCSHTQSMDVDEDSEQNLDMSAWVLLEAYTISNKILYAGSYFGTTTMMLKVGI